MSDRRSNSRTRREQEVYNRAMHVLARMRRTGDSLTAAARNEQIDPRTVRKYLGVELKKLADGQTLPTKADRRLRRMWIPTSRGKTAALIRGSAQASKLGRYMSAVGNYLRTGNTQSLVEFEGLVISGHTLITDPDALSSLAQAGALELDRIYALPESSS
jgi:hypothetical protein